MKHQDLIINALSITPPKLDSPLGFYKVKRSGRIPIQQKEFSEIWIEKHPELSEVGNLYYDFTTSDGAHYYLETDPEQSPQFTSHYIHRVLLHAFKALADVRGYNFVNSVEVWFRDPGADEFGYEAYKKYSLCAQKRWYTKGWGLSVRFEGHSYTLIDSVLEYDGNSTDINRVIYKGFTFKYEDIPEEQMSSLDYNAMFPVVNTTIRRRSGSFSSPQHGKNKVAEYYREIEWLRKEVLTRDQIQKKIAIEPSGWVKIPNELAYRTSKNSHQLMFRNGETHYSPIYGMKDYGPYRPPGTRHFRILFIMNRKDAEAAGRDLKEYLAGRKDRRFKGLKQYANIPLQFSGDPILYSDDENPLPEVIEQLDGRDFEPGVRYLALYLSPIDKEENDPVKHRVYYRMKEELLKRGISSQVVERSSVEKSDFWFSLVNIAVAILAKLGGIPWQLSAPPEPELIVGIGAFRPQELHEPYVGSAFCFTNDGTFKGFQCFSKKETDMLAGSIHDALLRYVRENGDVNRLVIHYYKQMSYRERKPIMDMLRSLELNIPVVVVTLAKTEYRSAVLFDRASALKVPVSGTYINELKNSILICNNTRYSGREKKLKSYPFPVRMQLWCSDDQLFKKISERRKLADQVYQFSRLYWKSLVQQSLPVTIKYPEMVAEMFPYFKSRTLPSFGEENLWFL